MNAQPGWYDAGVPEREHWWDGTQWTAHEREIAAARFLPMGWYPVPGTSDVRWWDGAGWTPHHIRDGEPRPDTFAIEPPSTGLALGIAFIVLGLSQVTAYSLVGQVTLIASSAIFFVTGAIWLICGVHGTQVHKLAAPQTTPVYDASIRPLPGEADSQNAGWYPVFGQVTRWWTGTQWSSYIAHRSGVRPIYGGPRGYAIVMVVGWVLVGLGALAVLFGFAMIGPLGIVIAIIIIACAGVLVLMGGLVLLLMWMRRYMMILPPQPPPPLR